VQYIDGGLEIIKLVILNPVSTGNILVEQQPIMVLNFR
jgi:hypothetical protein